MATRCFNHSLPILPEFTPDVLKTLYREHDKDWRCICGEPWNLPDHERVLSEMGSIPDFQAMKDWYDVRTGFQKKPPAKSVKATNEDVSARWYLITLTQPDTIKEPIQIIKNTLKIIKSKMVSPISWCYCLELTESGTPHTHIALYTDKYPEFKKLNKFHNSPAGSPWRMDIRCEKYDVKGYVQKSRTKPSAEWLATYGLDDSIYYSDNFPEELKYIPEI